MKESHLSEEKVENWFINARERIIKKHTGQCKSKSKKGIAKDLGLN